MFLSMKSIKRKIFRKMVYQQQKQLRCCFDKQVHNFPYDQLSIILCNQLYDALYRKLQDVVINPP